jgi:hypothetical protein
MTPRRALNTTKKRSATDGGFNRKAGEAKKMTLLERRLRRRQLLRAGAVATGSLLLPGRAPAQGGAKPLSGTTLNIAC